MLQQYLARNWSSQLLANPKSLKFGGSLQEITVLFSDIRSLLPIPKNILLSSMNTLRKWLK